MASSLEPHAQAPGGRTALQQRLHLDQVQRILSANADQLDPVVTLGLVARAVSSLLDATSVAIFLADPASGGPRRVAGVGSGHDERLEELAGEAIDGDPLVTLEGIRSPDRRGLAVAVARQRQVIGAISVAWDDPVGAIDRFDEQVLGMLSASATIALNQANAARLVEESTRLAEASVRRARDVAAVDPLTGLENRSAAYARLERWSAANPPAVIAIDLDRFRVINEAHGMVVGDEVLRGVADRLRAATRVDDVIARVASDEFVIVIEAHSEEQLLDVARRVRSAMRTPINVGEYALPLTASVGAAIARDGEAAAVVMLNADRARSHAKLLGGDRVVLFDASLGTSSHESAILERELASAITADEFVLHFQPIVLLPERTLVGAEALVRWDHPTRGLLGPGTFLPIAEVTGRISRLDRLVFERSIAQLRDWLDRGVVAGRFRVSINVSADRFRESDLLDTVRAAMSDPRLENRVRFELTETSVMGDEMRAVEIMHALHVAGVQTALDDFGTGWSSLAYLKRFPVDAIKVDRAFVVDIVDDPDDQAIVEAVVALARSLGLMVLAEGVETPEQERILIDLGCELGQGFLYDRPLPPDEFERRWLGAGRRTTQ